MIQKIFNFLKEILAPKQCCWCKSYGAFLCYSCFESIETYPSVCYICKKPSKKYFLHKNCATNAGFFLERICIAKEYHSPIKHLIKKGKYYKNREIFVELGDYLYATFHEVFCEENIVLVSVPMYHLKKYKRGYNSSEILTKHIGIRANIPYVLDSIRKIHSTPSQTELTKWERKRNRDYAFEWNNTYTPFFQWKTVIILDDVITTGNTLNTLAKFYKENGAKTVYGMCIASSLKKR